MHTVCAHQRHKLRQGNTALLVYQIECEEWKEGFLP